jgi:hypothetical protein
MARPQRPDYWRRCRTGIEEATAEEDEVHELAQSLSSEYLSTYLPQFSQAPQVFQAPRVSQAPQVSHFPHVSEFPQFHKIC